MAAHTETCDHCGRLFRMFASWVKRSRFIRCPECRAALGYGEIRKCAYCGDAYPLTRSYDTGSKGFCSFECSRRACFFSQITYVDGHWLWIGCKGPGGYGRFTYEGVPQYTHALAWEWDRGAANRYLANQCGRADCCNPDHWSTTQPAHKWRRPPRPAQRKLSREQYRVVKERLASGATLRAAALGMPPISLASLFKIKRGEVYRDWEAELSQLEATCPL